MAKDLLKLDLYKILGVEETAGEKEIVKGYRKKALKCHPDKNPDNPKAAEEFHQLSEALEILTDPAARSAYDRSRKAKKEAEARTKALDSKRKKFKEDLEAREQEAEERLKAQKTARAEKNLREEIERLKREGSRLLEQEQQRLREELQRQDVSDTQQSVPGGGKEEDIPRIKLKWKSSKDDTTNGGYSESVLTDIFSRYGSINSLIVSAKRNGSAILEFDPPGVLFSILEEKGLPQCPLTMVWLSGKPSEDSLVQTFKNGSPHLQEPHHAVPFNIDSQNREGSGGAAKDAALEFSKTNSIDSTDKDFESLVLMKMRQAEERKRLIAQMQKEDEENG